jgi:hypothetical protein
LELAKGIFLWLIHVQTYNCKLLFINWLWPLGIE